LSTFDRSPFEGSVVYPIAEPLKRFCSTPIFFCECTLSGLAGVYNEWILKKYYSESLHVQNIYLYTYGSLLNLVPTIGIPLLTSQSLDQFNLFRGFSIYTWLIIVTQALNGLFMSVVIKHTSNIIRLFVISFSLIVTTLLSIIVFHLTLNFYFVISFASMICALWLYYAN
jgi:probable UDP-sugar transporter A4